MKYCFIINPKAGKGDFVAKLTESISEACTRASADFDAFVSGGIEETREYVKKETSQAGEKVAFIACGGDGTLCKTVLAVMSLPKEFRQKCVVGVVPVGTGNDFVSNFANKEKFFDVDAQLKGETYEIDLLKCNDVYSINMVNIGFDCHVVCKKEEIGRRKWLPKKFSYIFSLIITLIRKPGVKLKMQADGEDKGEKELLLTTFANGAFCGGGFNSNPTACLTDGQIDSIAVKNVGRLKFLSLVGDYKNGRHLGEKFKDIVSHFKCEAVQMEFDEETPISVDGEIIRANELSLSVERGALCFLLPAGVRAKIEAAAQKPVMQ